VPFRSASPAIVAALLFGASTPAAKLLIGDMPPLLLAGLLYLGSGIGLGIFLAFLLVRTSGAQRRAALRIPHADVPWLLGAIVSGGVFAPALLMVGLARTSAAAASLLLNVEGVLTAVLAWVVFRENADRRIVLGMLAIVMGGALLSWKPGSPTFSMGALLVVAACFFWAVDNNLTGKVSMNDAMLIACVKGVLAGACNTSLAVVAGAQLPALPSAFWGAAALMAPGVWLHLHERHEHSHEPLVHSHSHRHDRHHRHWDAFPCGGEEPRAHLHRPEALTHNHPHYPDIHHRHPR